MIKDIRLKDLKRSDIIEQINARSGAETKRMIKLTVNQILETAIDDGLIYKNVCRKISLSTPKPKEKRALTLKEREAIKACDFTPMEKIFVDILFYCGLRRSEALALTVNDIDFQRKELIINKSLSWIKGTQIKEPKSPCSIRRVNAPDVLINELKSYLLTINTLYLFTGANGKIISESTYKRFWKRIYNKINEKQSSSTKNNIHLTNIELCTSNLTPHVFRHNYATMLYHSGVDLKEAQRLMGHSSIKITLEIYTHLAEISQSTSTKINSFIM